MRSFIGIIIVLGMFAGMMVANYHNVNMPPRDVCNLPPSIIEQCKASPDCALNARELQLWKEHQEMLELMCID